MVWDVFLLLEIAQKDQDFKSYVLVYSILFYEREIENGSSFNDNLIIYGWGFDDISHATIGTS